MLKPMIPQPLLRRRGEAEGADLENEAQRAKAKLRSVDRPQS
jgi:hypothetical protein